MFNLTAKSRSINNNLHGIYNNEDRNVIQGIALGRMAYMYRKWIKPTLNKKFGKAAYNLDLQDETEGYYRTLFRFLKAVKNDWKTMKYKSIATNKEQLNEKEKQNLRRARAELYRFCLLLLLSGLLDLDDDDDEKRKSRKDRPWAVNMAEVLVRRARTEVGSTLPTFSMLREGVKIINSPMAGVDTLEKIFDFVELIIAPWTGFDVLESGRYKGHTVAYKLFMESPLLISSKNIYKTAHPEDLIQFYK